MANWTYLSMFDSKAMLHHPNLKVN